MCPLGGLPPRSASDICALTSRHRRSISQASSSSPRCWPGAARVEGGASSGGDRPYPSPKVADLQLGRERRLASSCVSPTPPSAQRSKDHAQTASSWTNAGLNVASSPGGERASDGFSNKPRGLGFTPNSREHGSEVAGRCEDAGEPELLGDVAVGEAVHSASDGEATGQGCLWTPGTGRTTTTGSACRPHRSPLAVAVWSPSSPGVPASRR